MTIRTVLVVVASLLAAAAIVYGGTYAAYFAVAMQRPPKSPFTVTCTPVTPPRRGRLKIRFDVENAADKDATYLNFALFAPEAARRNLGDWGYALQTRVPARGSASATVAVPLPAEAAGLRFSAVRCNLINAAFADGSQQDYAGDNASFP